MNKNEALLALAKSIIELEAQLKEEELAKALSVKTLRENALAAMAAGALAITGGNYANQGVDDHFDPSKEGAAWNAYGKQVDRAIPGLGHEDRENLLRQDVPRKRGTFPIGSAGHADHEGEHKLDANLGKLKTAGVNLPQGLSQEPVAPTKGTKAFMGPTNPSNMRLSEMTKNDILLALAKAIIEAEEKLAKGTEFGLPKDKQHPINQDFKQRVDALPPGPSFMESMRFPGPAGQADAARKQAIAGSAKQAMAHGSREAQMDIATKKARHAAVMQRGVNARAQYQKEKAGLVPPGPVVSQRPTQAQLTADRFREGSGVPTFLSEKKPSKKK